MVPIIIKNFLDAPVLTGLVVGGWLPVGGCVRMTDGGLLGDREFFTSLRTAWGVDVSHFCVLNEYTERA